jgi:hypothetical protein
MRPFVWKAIYVAVFFGVGWSVWISEWNATNGQPDPAAFMGSLIIGFLAALALFLLNASIAGAWWWLLERRERQRLARSRPDVPLPGLLSLVEKGGDDARLVGGGTGRSELLEKRRRLGVDKDTR